MQGEAEGRYMYIFAGDKPYDVKLTPAAKQRHVRSTYAAVASYVGGGGGGARRQNLWQAGTIAEDQ